MGVLNQVGKIINSRWGGTALAAGAGMAYAGYSSNLIEGDENTYGMQQALFEGVLNDPYADVAVTGGRVNMFGYAFNPISNHLPGKDFRAKARAFRTINRENFGTAVANLKSQRALDKYHFLNQEDSGGVYTFQDAGEKIYGTVYDATESRGYNEDRKVGYSYPYMQSEIGARAGTYNAGQNMGDIVHGLYNMRHGG